VINVAVEDCDGPVMRNARSVQMDWHAAASRLSGTWPTPLIMRMHPHAPVPAVVQEAIEPAARGIPAKAHRVRLPLGRTLMAD
jgi:hypothetical protein